MHLLLRLPLLAVPWMVASAVAQTPLPAPGADVRQAYERDVQACHGAGAAADVATCLKEARNSLAEIRRGRLGDPLPATEYERNALRRCDVHQGADRADCLARMRGQGSIEGSVASGGILRSLTTVVPAN